VSGIVLVTLEVYSQCLTSYWSPRRYIPSVWHRIGHLGGILPVSDLLLVTSEVYSQCLTSYWSPRRCVCCRSGRELWNAARIGLSVHQPRLFTPRQKSMIEKVGSLSKMK
jgi:hypothetical protein